jgi:energy-converting hydrogenase Eha subunit C
MDSHIFDPKLIGIKNYISSAHDVKFKIMYLSPHISISAFISSTGVLRYLFIDNNSYICYKLESINNTIRKIPMDKIIIAAKMLLSTMYTLIDAFDIADISEIGNSLIPIVTFPLLD